VGTASLLLQHMVDELTYFYSRKTGLASADAWHRATALRQIHAHLGDQATEPQVRENLAPLRARGLAISSGHAWGARWKCL
jgi:hypothetical protein